MPKSHKNLDLVLINQQDKLLKEGEESTINVYRARVVLKPDKKSIEGYKMITTYPIE